MWERICDRFGLDNAAVVSMSRLTAANYAADRARRKTLRSAGPTLIDEAHNFRNNSQRRRTLPNFLKSGKRHKTVLLSATPQNPAAPGHSASTGDVPGSGPSRAARQGAAYDVADFRAGEWRDDSDGDRAALQAIYESVKELTPADDAKLQAVKSFVTTPGVNAEKLLIFTESTVTARYLYDEPSQSNDAGTVGILTGADAKGVAKMTRFSPASNGAPTCQPDSRRVS